MAMDSKCDHGIAEAQKTVTFFQSRSVGRSHLSAANERGNQQEQRRVRLMEVRYETIDRAKLKGRRR
jgi:hypothetical protein